MSRNRSSFVFLGFAAMATVACPLAAGCMAEESGGMVADDGSKVEIAALALTGDPDDPPTGHNPFPPSCFWDSGVQQTYVQLATGPLTNALGVLPPMPSLPALPAAGDLTKACRNKALKYLIECALPQGAFAIDPVTGKAHEGRFGLAPSWQTQPLDSTTEEWMTSCLAAHLNNKDVSVTLLLEANHSGFYFDSNLKANFPQRDSISWGNIFAPDPSGSPQIHVCYFNELEKECSILPEEAINNRMCDQVPGCGVVLRGNCDAACTWDDYGYWACDNVAQHSTNFRVRLADFSMYGPSCMP